MWLLYLPGNVLDCDQQDATNCVLMTEVIEEFLGVVIGMDI